MTDERELMWAAGLFEGEGCITHNGRNKKRLVGSPKLVLCMTDRDVVERFMAAVGVGHILDRKMPMKCKQQFEWRSCVADDIRLALRRMWPGLCQRRRKRALELYPWFTPAPTLGELAQTR